MPEKYNHSNLRLAVLTQSISHFETPLFRLCENIKGLEFKVFYIKPVKQEQFDSQYCQKINWGYDMLSGYNSQQVNGINQMENAYQNWRADVVLIYGYSWPGITKLIIKNWLHGQPQIHRGTLHYSYDPRRGIKGKLTRPLSRLLLRLFDAHHYGGDYSRRFLKESGVQNSSMFFVPYSVDTHHFLLTAEQSDVNAEAVNIRERLGWSTKQNVILIIAQQCWVKGVDIAMHVFASLAQTDPENCFLVVGSGPMNKYMKDYATENIHSKQIHFAGFVPSANTIPYYLTSDLVLCTSRYETWARMANEAMLCRRPCIVSSVVAASGGLIINGENGYVVDAPDANQFVLGIQQYFSLSDNEKLKMGEAAREQAKQFSYEQNIDNVIAATQYALENSKNHQKKQS